MCSGQRAPRLQRATKFDPVTRLARNASEPVTKLARNSKRPSQQAVMERVCDKKSGERRGHHLQMTTQMGACFRRIFAAQIPPSPQRDPGGKASSQRKAKRPRWKGIFTTKSKTTQVERHLHNEKQCDPGGKASSQRKAKRHGLGEQYWPPSKVRRRPGPVQKQNAHSATYALSVCAIIIDDLTLT